MSSVPQLTATNYCVWSMKLEAVLGLKRRYIVLFTDRSIGDKKCEKWDSDNKDAVCIIKLSLSNQVMQFTNETNAKTKIKETYVERLEDSKIDAN